MGYRLPTGNAVSYAWRSVMRTLCEVIHRKLFGVFTNRRDIQIGNLSDKTALQFENVDLKSHFKWFDQMYRYMTDDNTEKINFDNFVQIDVLCDNIKHKFFHHCNVDSYFRRNFWKEKSQKNPCHNASDANVESAVSSARLQPGSRC